MMLVIACYIGIATGASIILSFIGRALLDTQIWPLGEFATGVLVGITIVIATEVSINLKFG